MNHSFKGPEAETIADFSAENAPDPRVLAIHPRVLAHLGDAVYELLVRELAIQQLVFQQGLSAAEAMHRFCTARSRAAYQAKLLEAWLPQLTPEELALTKRARNLPVPVARRKQQAIYRQATALEALMGWWYFSQADRWTVMRQMLQDYWLSAL